MRVVRAGEAGGAQVTDREHMSETVELQQLLQEIASRTADKHDADAIRLAADMLEPLRQDMRKMNGG